MTDEHSESLDFLARQPDAPPRRVRFADIAKILAGDLTQPEADRLARDDGAHLCYSGRINGFQGEPESGKTWVGLIAVARTLDLGGIAAFLDLEDTATAAVARLRLLGVSHRHLVNGLRYIGREEVEELTGEEIALSIVAENADDVLIDSVGELMARYGLNEDKAEDVLKLRRVFLAPIAAAGSTVYLIDHVAKDRESRGRWARGSGAKLGLMDGAVYSVDSGGFNRTTPGRIRLTVQKDRHGSLPGKRGDVVASIYMQPGDDLLRFTIDTPAPPAPTVTENKTTTDRALFESLTADVRAVTIDDPDAGMMSRRELLAAVRARRHRLELDGFADSKIDAVLSDLVTSGDLVTAPSPRRKDLTVYGPPPQQTRLEVDE